MLKRNRGIRKSPRGEGWRVCAARRARPGVRAKAKHRVVRTKNQSSPEISKGRIYLFYVYEFSYFLNYTKLCTAGAWILSDFFGAWRERFLRHSLSFTCLLPLFEGLFDEPILDAVEGN